MSRGDRRAGTAARRRWRPVWICFALCLLSSLSARGSTESAEQLYSRGLIELHAGRQQEALDLFNRAVDVDAADYEALYYRGVTRGRLGDLDGARADLQAVLEKKPELTRAALESGIVLTQLERYRDAIPLLERAKSEPEMSTDASFFLGLAHWRLGETGAARAELQSAALEGAPTETAAHYYLGLIDYQAGEAAAAEQHLTRVTTASAGTPMGREARQLLDTMQQGPRPFRLHGVLGLQYDSNVALAPTSDTLKDTNGITDENDGRFTISAGAEVTALKHEYVRIAVGYDFYQSIHFDLSEFNIQDHRANVQVSSQYGPLSGGVQGAFNYVFLKYASFLSQGSVLPWLTLSEGSFGQVDLFYRLRGNDFHKEPFNGLRDARNHSTGLRQTFYLGHRQRTLSIGYRFDRENPYSARPPCAVGDTDCTPPPDAYAYDGHEFNIGFSLPLPARFVFDTGYAYRREDYDEDASNSRLDKESLITVAVHKAITDNFSVTAGYFGDLNDSSDGNFEYERHIASLALEARY